MKLFYSLPKSPPKIQFILQLESTPQIPALPKSPPAWLRDSAQSWSPAWLLPNGQVLSSVKGKGWWGLRAEEG